MQQRISKPHKAPVFFCIFIVLSSFHRYAPTRLRTPHNVLSGAKMSAKFSFSDIKLRSLKPGEYWDASVPAFGIRVGTRTATFILKKGNSRIKIGRFPNMTLQVARRQAVALKDASEQPTPAITLGAALELYLTVHGETLRTRSRYQINCELRKLEGLRHKKLQSVTTHELMEIVDKNKRIAKNNVFRAARSFFMFCKRRRLLEKSPLDYLPMPSKQVARSRVLTDDELRGIHQAALSDGGTFSNIVLLLMYAGQRRSETAALQFSWINENEKTITIPGSVTKNGRSHLFPMGALVSTLVASLYQNSNIKNGHGLLFPGRENSSEKITVFSNWNRAKRAFNKTCDLYDWTLHDLRRTYRTIHARIGTPPHIAERLINHVGSTPEVQRIYERYTYMPEMVKAVAAFDEELEKILQVRFVPLAAHAA